MSFFLKSHFWNFHKNIYPTDNFTVSWKGIKFLLHVDDYSHCFNLWASNFKPFEEIKALTQFIIRKGDWIIDVGANYGYTATFFASAVAHEGEVLAVEAAPHTVERLKLQLSKAGVTEIVRVAPVAVGAAEGEVKMKVSMHARQDCQYILPENTEVQDERSYLDQEINVKLTTLDRLLAKYGMKEPALIKIDVEGYEIPVLKGAPAVLECANPPWLFVEVLSPSKEMTKGSSDELLAMLGAYSQSMYFFSNGIFSPCTVSVIKSRLEEVPYMNVLVRPPKGKYINRL